jgi:hypothetical protein
MANLNNLVVAAATAAVTSATLQHNQQLAHLLTVMWSMQTQHASTAS